MLHHFKGCHSLSQFERNDWWKLYLTTRDNSLQSDNPLPVLYATASFLLPSVLYFFMGE